MNVWGTYAVIQAALPFMKERKAGHILNFSSIAGIRAGPGSTVYCASKHAVEALSEGLSQEVKDFGIKVTLIEPGYFRHANVSHCKCYNRYRVD